MTDRIALFLALALVLLLVIDAQIFDWANTLFLVQKLTELTEWLAFWR
ncbi:hypothetical protein [Maritimibacter sp. 55A14]|nr:hypothetical protein [Maritimibacter sp. 55A14]